MDWTRAEQVAVALGHEMGCERGLEEAARGLAVATDGGELWAEVVGLLMEAVESA
jgi:hypothetical protein